MAIVLSVLGWIGAHLGASATAAAVVVQIIWSKFPTAKPWGWFHIARDFFVALASACDSIAKFLDKVLPQNIAAPTPVTVVAVAEKNDAEPA
jgi:hypothetical protein